MEKYIVKCDIKELYLKKGEILIIKNNTPCLAKNEERKFPYIDLHNTKIFEPFTEKWLEKVEIYYFLSSKGVVQSAVTGKDEEADKWRKITNNFFTTKKCAQEEKIKILNKVINSKQKTN